MRTKLTFLGCMVASFLGSCLAEEGAHLSSACPRLKIAIINGVSFHFEVVAGLLHVLKPYEKNVEVFLSPWIQSQNYDGARDLLNWSKATFRTTSSNIKALKIDYDLAILVSTDYELLANKKILEQMQPRVTVAIVHNSDFEDMPGLLSLRRGMNLLTLSPHVAASLNKSSGHPTDWLLPIYPVGKDPGCTSTLNLEQVVGPSCLRGFAMQGKFSNLRRNYTAMWTQILDHLSALKEDPQVAKVFHINVLGKGPDRLRLPPALQQYVTVHRRLPFESFYSTISHALALVPSLASPTYFTTKFSSTIITSLSTATPIIASSTLLATYSFLSRASVFPQEDDEEEIDAMLRIAHLPASTILEVRKQLQSLRKQLNDRSLRILEGFISQACAARESLSLGLNY